MRPMIAISPQMAAVALIDTRKRPRMLNALQAWPFDAVDPRNRFSAAVSLKTAAAALAPVSDPNGPLLAAGTVLLLLLAEGNHEVAKRSRSSKDSTRR